MSARNQHIHVLGENTSNEVFGGFGPVAGISKYGANLEDGRGRIEVYFMDNPVLHAWTFFVVGPAEKQRTAERWYKLLRKLAWNACGYGGGCFALYLPPEQVERLVADLPLAADSTPMISPLLNYIEEGLGDKTGPP